MTTGEARMNRAAQDFFKARAIIAALLAEIMPNAPAATNEHNAAAIMARLAHADPPILIVRADDVKE